MALRQMMPLNTLSVLDPLHTPFLGKQGADAGNLLLAEPKQPGHYPSPPSAPLDVPLW